MPEELVVRHCAPTLAGLKTASLFTVIPDSEEKLRRDVAELNDKLNGRRIHALVLGRFRNRARIYLYRPERLREDLHDDLAVQILCERGYDPDDLNQCLDMLVQKLEGNEQFPHEIGLFLGYPPGDVQGFIENLKPCKCVGAWKVYTDEGTARKTFERFQKCRDIYERQVSIGIPLQRLAV